MKIEKEFTLLRIENKLRTKEDGTKSTYLIVSVLDENLTPCSFFVFNDGRVDAILKDSTSAKPLEKVLISFDLSYNGKMWNCNLENMLFSY